MDLQNLYDTMTRELLRLCDKSDGKLPVFAVFEKETDDSHTVCACVVGYVDHPYRLDVQCEGGFADCITVGGKALDGGFEINDPVLEFLLLHVSNLSVDSIAYLSATFRLALIPDQGEIDEETGVGKYSDFDSVCVFTMYIVPKSCSIVARFHNVTITG